MTDRVPSRRANMLPMASVVTVRPSASHHSRNKARPSRSASVRAVRSLPPRGKAPIAPSVMRPDQETEGVDAHGQFLIVRSRETGGPPPVDRNGPRLFHLRIGPRSWRPALQRLHRDVAEFDVGQSVRRQGQWHLLPARESRLPGQTQSPWNGGL